MAERRIASRDDGGAGKALAFLADVANGEVDVATMRQEVLRFLAADGGNVEFPLSPLLTLELSAMTPEGLEKARSKLEWLVRRIGPQAAAGEGIRVAGLWFFAGGRSGLLVAGPLEVLLLYQAIRLLNRHRAVLEQCAATKPHSREHEPCGRWFVAVGNRGPRRRFCGPTCRGRKWSATRCVSYGRELRSSGKCSFCGRVRRRWTSSPAALQRIATEVGTGRVKAPQFQVAPTKNARQSTRGKGGR